MPIFYIIELLAVGRKVKHNVFGAGGLHSLVHISGISASSFIVYIKNDYNILDTILILSSFLVGILLFYTSMKCFKISHKLFW